MQPRTASPRSTYWRPFRLAALFSLFAVLAVTSGEPVWWLFLMFLVCLLPVPARRRAQP